MEGIGNMLQLLIISHSCMIWVIILLLYVLGVIVEDSCFLVLKGFLDEEDSNRLPCLSVTLFKEIKGDGHLQHALQCFNAVFLLQIHILRFERSLFRR